jgi:hypothetical protein
MLFILPLAYLLLLLAVFIVTPIMALMDLKKSAFKGAWQAYWVGLIVLMPLLGSIAYGLFAYRTKY